MTAYEIAKGGGKHAGLLRRFRSESRQVIARSMRSLTRQISAHELKLRDPAAFVEPDTPADEVRYLVEFKWPKELAGFREELEVFTGLLKERGDE